MLNPQTQNATETATGFIYDDKGHIVTACHVIGCSKIVDVTFADRNRISARITGFDPYSNLAVLTIIRQNVTSTMNMFKNGTPQLGNSTGIERFPLNLLPLSIGNISNVKIGEAALSIGYPFGISSSLTSGIVGQTKFLLTLPGLETSVPDIIQTDTAVNPGNSGGPLLDLGGQVIGMIYGRLNPTGVALGQYSGITIAIPLNSISRIISVLVERGNCTHLYLGLTGFTLIGTLSKTVNNLPLNFRGVLVNSVVKEGPADKAGLQGSTIHKYGKIHGGDIITAMDGHNVYQIEDLISYIDQSKSVGENVLLNVYRNDQAIELILKLGLLRS